MPVVHRTHVRISRVAAPLARRIGHHHLGLGANVRIALAQHDGVAITLRHLPPVEPRNPRRLRQHLLGFSKDVPVHETCEIWLLVQKVLDAYSLRYQFHQRTKIRDSLRPYMLIKLADLNTNVLTYVLLKLLGMP